MKREQLKILKQLEVDLDSIDTTVSLMENSSRDMQIEIAMNQYSNFDIRTYLPDADVTVVKQMIIDMFKAQQAILQKEYDDYIISQPI